MKWWWKKENGGMECLDKENYIKRFHFEDGKAEAVMTGPAMGFIADVIHEFFEAHNSPPNFLTFTVLPKGKIGGYEVTIRKTGGKTPAERIDELSVCLQDLVDIATVYKDIACGEPGIHDSVIEKAQHALRIA